MCFSERGVKGYRTSGSENEAYGLIALYRSALMW